MTAAGPSDPDLTARNTGGWLRVLRRGRPVAFIVAVGLVVTGLVLATMGRLESRKVESEFNRLADDWHASLQRSIHDHMTVLVAIGALYDAIDHVDREQFSRFVNPLLRRHRGIQALEWIPRIPDSERDAWEQEIRAEGFTDFHITERSVTGEMVPALRRNEYFPVAYLQPRRGNDRAFGYDVGSTRSRRQALDRAARTGRLVASEPVTLVQETGEQFGLLVFLAKYRDVARAPARRQEALAGFVLGVFRLGDLVAAAMNDGHWANLDTVVSDVTMPLNAQVLVRHGVPSPGGDEPSETVQRLTRERTFGMAGRTWRVTSTPSPDFLRAHRSQLSQSIVAGGLLVTGLVAGCVLVLVGRTARVERVVATRTRDLSAISRQQEQTNLELEHRDEEILRLCYAMTHDLQTPLASLAGGVDALERRLDGASLDQMKWMDRIRASTQRMVTMLDDLMVYARTGTEQIDSEPVDLCEVVKIAVEELQPLAEKKSIRVQCQCDSKGRCAALGDRKIVARVLTNLIDNAIKYVEADHHGIVQVRVTVAGAIVRITIQDNGPGIDPALLDDVFQPFRRASAGTAGTGLGLSIVRRYVTAMGGRVWLESDGNTGAMAVVELPLAERVDHTGKDRQAA